MNDFPNRNGIAMRGPTIIARSISVATITDRFGNHWQYHSQSDRHSKIACWAIMFDLLRHCPLLRQHAADGKVGFGINHEMKDFQTSRTKVLDLVICVPRKAVVGNTTTPKHKATNFVGLVNDCGVVLTPEESSELAALPSISVVLAGNVLIALEAKATMTAHVKALPRLHDELDSSHQTIHGDTDAAIAAALVTINLSDRFVSTSNNKHMVREDTVIWNKEPQPKSASRTVDKVREIRRRSKTGDQGFDAMGIVLLNFRNDGTECTVVESPPAPTPNDNDHYSNMIGRISTLYGSKFAAF